ncbi:MAG: hypothetical protein HKL84_02425, partial [Acidimicrobiaceae bacterium]|nr:hypothetical protein [Acidimicrobiaceae bacterium]
PSVFAGVLFLTLLASKGRYFKARRVPPWHSATIGVEGNASYTAFGFTNLLRHVLANVLGSVRERERIYPEREHGEQQLAHTIRYETRVTEPVQAFVYRPAAAAIFATVRFVKHLQSGRLEAYVGYMLIVLLITLVLIASFW